MILDFHICFHLVLYQGHTDIFPYYIKFKTELLMIIYAEHIMHIE